MLFIYVLCFVCCVLFVSTVLVDCCHGWWCHHGGCEMRMTLIYRIERGDGRALIGEEEGRGECCNRAIKNG